MLYKSAGGVRPPESGGRGRLKFLVDTTGLVVLGGLVAVLLLAAARWFRSGRQDPGTRDETVSTAEIEAAIERLEKRVAALEILLSESRKPEGRP